MKRLLKKSPAQRNLARPNLLELPTVRAAEPASRRLVVTLSGFALLTLLCLALSFAARLVAADQEGKPQASGGVDPGPEVLTTPRSRTGPVAPRSCAGPARRHPRRQELVLVPVAVTTPIGHLRHRPGQGKCSGSLRTTWSRKSKASPPRTRPCRWGWCSTPAAAWATSCNARARRWRSS